MSLITNIFTQRRVGNFIGVLACAALIAYALYAQHVLELEPCPLCIFQRVAVIVMGVIFLLATLHNPGKTGATMYGVLLSIAAIIGILIASRHVWIQAQPPGTVAACGATLDYMMQYMPIGTVINKVLAGSGECAEINWRMLGLAMPWWTLFAFVGLGLWALWVNVIAVRLFRDNHQGILR
jgi:disulfide bond formation protein DsbB